MQCLCASDIEHFACNCIYLPCYHSTAFSIVHIACYRVPSTCEVTRDSSDDPPNTCDLLRPICDSTCDFTCDCDCDYYSDCESSCDHPSDLRHSCDIHSDPCDPISRHICGSNGS